ncbi:MAG: hypothetical protein K0S38_579 [Candidatus Paceibacter sp.]|jgi:hypothetical protein|nr:hypothetical protein [Candidatus Paceibacter sp.]
MAAIKTSIAKIKGWYEHYESRIASVSLILGFIFDALLLKRVDTLLENFFIVLHLIGAAVGIIVLNIFENNVVKGKVSELARTRWHFWSIIVIQFMFGGLLSKYLVFYFRSATLATSWPFMLMLVLAFALNERMRHHYSRLSFQVSFLFLSIYAFVIYILPVLMHRIGNDVFILSGLVSLLVLGIFLVLLWLITREHFVRSRWIILSSVLSLFVGINILYFTNLIPPIPLSVKDAGVYHSISRAENGMYQVVGEPKTWRDFFHSSSVVHAAKGQQVYVYTAIFSPTNLNTTILHEWQYYNEQRKEWMTVSTVPLSVIGGRDEGFRTYSVKANVFPARWRVNVKTLQGKYISRVRFVVEYTNEPLHIIREMK